MNDIGEKANNRPKRKRITVIKSPVSDEKFEDYGENYQQNAASPNAKFLGEFKESWTHEFWIDKHYSDRKNFGDESGPRDGIDELTVETVIKKSISHLFYYSLKHTFAFINFPPKKETPYRVVLQELSNTLDTLNVVVEFHFLDTNKYEVTVRTAMRVEDFRIQDNQYVIQFSSEESVLFLMRNKNFTQIDTFS